MAVKLLAEHRQKLHRYEAGDNVRGLGRDKKMESLRKCIIEQELKISHLRDVTAANSRAGSALVGPGTGSMTPFTPIEVKCEELHAVILPNEPGSMQYPMQIDCEL